MNEGKLNWDDAPAWATHQLDDGMGQWHFVEHRQDYGVYLEFINYPEPAYLFTDKTMVLGSLEARPAFAPKRSWLRSMLGMVFIKKAAGGASQ